MQFFPKLHGYCSPRAVRNCTVTKRPRRALTNQVKLRPSNERPRHGYASFSLATVENGCTVWALALCKLSVPELKKRCENRTMAWRKCCHRNGGASSAAAVLFVAVMRTRTQALCCCFGTLGVSVVTPRFRPKASLHNWRTGQYSERIR